MSYAGGLLHRYSIDLYSRLSAEWNRDVGLKRVGNLRMARTRERMEEFETYATTAESIGTPHEWWSPADIKRKYPAGEHRGVAGRAVPSDRRLHQPGRYFSCFSPTRRARTAASSIAA